MKKYILLLIALVAISSCKLEDKITESDLDVSTPKLSELDAWLRKEFTTPYNIDVRYSWDDDEVDQSRYLFPPLIDNVKPAMEAIKTIWVDTYTKVGGKDFIKKIAPRNIVLIGGINLNPSGTITLGLAEGGKKIVFFSVDLVDFKNRASLTRFISTIQHEYTHILNQTVPFDEPNYGQITPGNYTAQWFNESIKKSRELGYITSYARANPFEDFAEMVKTMLSSDKTGYDKIINNITSAKAKKDLRKKEAFVVEYFLTEFNIDFYELQKVAAANIEKILN
ncbi:substrate import-associated zinc metallohydrolase lipoprotein [Polaribacter cellanae]|uniref:Substrate import-associated zinc metallohydrolase lipoprotein n=1 Tax=Polaribacter cellanae TaxID=2818493 RepID=A0A975H818_9FLAO|nr:substrate import-associated zinc metallohydrolase lipoprotein [Polaribacter cellanae]QTE24106.1 hypothetical protein J3359_07535 [Polaribacter cellanae]